MKWLGFIALVLVVLLIITITGFIIAYFVNLQKEREKEFGILIRELKEIKEVVGTFETRVIKLESLIENDVRNDVEKVNEIVRQNLIRKS